MLWAARTPPHFRFHEKGRTPDRPARRKSLDFPLVSAGCCLPTSPRREDLCGDLPPDLDEVWTNFLDALAPLQEAGDLGGILLQYRDGFFPRREQRKLLASAAGAARWVGTVEFRNRSWFSSEKSTKWR